MAELSGFEVLALVKEVDSTLRGTYVNNIYTMGVSQLVRLRKPGGEDIWLVVSPKKGVWVSEKVKQRAETSEFTSKLRAELERARFVGASQADLDRVFELEFQAMEKRRMIVELMPPGNVIVTDGEGKILLAEEEVRSQARRVMRGVAYKPPKQSRLSPAEAETESVRAMLGEEKTVGSAIGKHVALPRKYVSECLKRLGLTNDSESSSLDGREQEVVRVLHGMVQEARETPRPCICETPKGPDVFAIPPQGIDVIEVGKTISQLCDELFLDEAEALVAVQTPEEGKRKELESTISKLRSESERMLAEASRARSAAMAAGRAPLTEAIDILRAREVQVAKEPTSSASVASILFDQAKNLERKSAEALAAAGKLEKKLPKAGPEHSPRNKLLPKKKQEWYEKFRWFFTSDGKLAVGGRDAQTNATLVSRHMEDNDTVYHSDLLGSPFFVLKGGKDQSEEEVRQVAQATVAFSSAWKTGLGSADAYWVNPEQVSAAAPSGEYLPKGSFAIKGKKNFVNKVIVEVAVGLDRQGRVLAGPEGAIGRQSPSFLVLRPQKEKGSDTAKHVLKHIGAFQGTPQPPALDEILRMLPTGGGKVIRRGTGTQPTPTPE